jgi:hypothetical protein
MAKRTAWLPRQQELEQLAVFHANACRNMKNQLTSDLSDYPELERLVRFSCFKHDNWSRLLLRMAKECKSG